MAAGSSASTRGCSKARHLGSSSDSERTQYACTRCEFIENEAKQSPLDAFSETALTVVGEPDGDDDGGADGAAVGFFDGDSVGEDVGSVDGDSDGDLLGLFDGGELGGAVGSCVGFCSLGMREILCT